MYNNISISFERVGMLAEYSLKPTGSYNCVKRLYRHFENASVLPKRESRERGGDQGVTSSYFQLHIDCVRNYDYEVVH